VLLLEGARTGFSELGARWEAARTGLELARTLLQAGRQDDARGHVERSLPVLEELRSLREIEVAKRQLPPPGH
jgi:hypothetical protein